MKLLYILPLLTLLTTLPVQASTQTAHVHGQAEGVMTISNTEVRLNLSLPADSVVGFEHTPTTTQEKASVTKAISSLQKETLFSIYGRKRFLKKRKELLHQIHLNEVTHTSKYSGADEELATHPTKKHVNHEEHEDHESHEDHEEHSEFHVSLILKMPSKQPISLIKTQLFNRLPGLEILRLQFIQGDQQLHLEFTKDHPYVRIPKH